MDFCLVAYLLLRNLLKGGQSLVPSTASLVFTCGLTTFSSCKVKKIIYLIFIWCFEAIQISYSHHHFWTLVVYSKKLHLYIGNEGFSSQHCFMERIFHSLFVLHQAQHSPPLPVLFSKYLSICPCGANYHSACHCGLWVAWVHHWFHYGCLQICQFWYKGH